MIEDVRGLYPIGTVVSLKKGEKKLMIFGIVQTAQDESGQKQYDYIGVPYPEGNMGPNFQYLFHHENIENVYYLGFHDAERQVFIENLASLFEKKDAEAK